MRFTTGIYKGQLWCDVLLIDKDYIKFALQTGIIKMKVFCM